MRRISCMAVAAGVLALTVVTVSAKIEIGGSVGYGFAAGGELDTKSMTYNEDFDNVTEVTHIYPSYGNGLKLGGDVTVYLNDNVGIMVVGGFSVMGGYNSDYSYVSSSSSYDIEDKINANHLHLNIGTKLKTDLNRGVSPYVFFTPGIYIPLGVTYDHTDTDGADYTYKSEYTFSIGTGFASGAGVCLNITEKLGFKIEMFADYAFARLSKVVSANGSGEVYDVEYVNDTANLEDDRYIGNTAYRQYAGKPQYSFSSVGLKFGLVLGF